MSKRGLREAHDNGVLKAESLIERGVLNAASSSTLGVSLFVGGGGNVEGGGVSVFGCLS